MLVYLQTYLLRSLIGSFMPALSTKAHSHILINIILTMNRPGDAWEDAEVRIIHGLKQSQNYCNDNNLKKCSMYQGQSLKTIVVEQINKYFNVATQSFTVKRSPGNYN